MAMTCARCGAQNPDGNRFCNSCGTPLVPSTAQTPAVAVGASAGAPPTWIAPAPAAPPAAPPAAAPAPPPGYAAPPYAPPQPAYQSPYYSPGPGQQMPPVHRTPWVVIISVVVVMVLVLSGIGTVLALTLGHKTSTGSSTFSSVSTPTPAVSPGQTPQPSTEPTQAPGGQTVANDGETVVVPSGWTVLNKDADSISLQSPDGDGTLTVASGPFSPPQTAQQIKDQIDKELASKYPDAASCPDSGTSQGDLAGVNGIFWTECFTLTSGGQTVSVGEPLWAGANSKGSIGYVLVLQTTQDNLEKFIKECTPILQSGITWKLK